MRSFPASAASLGGLMAAALILSGSPEARAQGAESRVHELKYDTRIDLSVTLTLATWLVASELMKAELVPEKCRWCYRGIDGADALNPVDGTVRRALMWRNPHAADVTSSVIAFAVLPASSVGLVAVAAEHDAALAGFPKDTLLIAETTAIAATVNQAVKFAFARERPFVHYLPRSPEGLRALTDSPSDDNLSFYSGHTNLAFALATSSGTIASLRGYSFAPVVWATGLALATSVGYLRIAADKHYLSDVLTGVIVGSLIGVGAPLLFHGRSSPEAER